MFNQIQLIVICFYLFIDNQEMKSRILVSFFKKSILCLYVSYSQLESLGGALARQFGGMERVPYTKRFVGSSPGQGMYRS